MGDPQRSNPGIRRRLVTSVGLTALLAALLLVGADSQRVVIANWIAAEPSSSLARMRGVLVGLSLVGVSPLLFYAVALWRVTGRKGTRPTLAMDEGLRRRTRRVAAVLLAIACAIPLSLWWLAATVTPTTR